MNSALISQDLGTLFRLDLYRRVNKSVYIHLYNGTKTEHCTVKVIVLIERVLSQTQNNICNY